MLNAPVVQWIRTLDYGSSNKRSNRFGSTKRIKRVVTSGMTSPTTLFADVAQRLVLDLAARPIDLVKVEMSVRF